MRACPASKAAGGSVGGGGMLGGSLSVIHSQPLHNQMWSEPKVRLFFPPLENCKALGSPSLYKKESSMIAA